MVKILIKVYYWLRSNVDINWKTHVEINGNDVCQLQATKSTNLHNADYFHPLAIFCENNLSVPDFNLFITVIKRFHLFRLITSKASKISLIGYFRPVAQS